MRVWLEIDGQPLPVDLPAGLDGAIECSVDGRGFQVEARALQPGLLSLLLDGRQYRCVLEGDAVLINGQRFAFRVEDPRSLQGRKGSGAGADGPRALKAPMPGRVVRVLVAVGDEVSEAQGILVIEAMKMQNELKAPKAGKVSRVSVGVGDTVSSGDVMVVIE